MPVTQLVTQLCEQLWGGKQLLQRNSCCNGLQRRKNTKCGFHQLIYGDVDGRLAVATIETKVEVCNVQ